MKKLTLSVIWFVLSVMTLSALASPLSLPNNLIAYNSPAGKKLLIRSANSDYLQLSMQFLTQKNQAYCGVASLSMVLNALNVPGPNDAVYAPFNPITQDNFFTPAVAKVIDSQIVSKHGMTLDQAAAAAAAWQVDSQAFHSDRLSLTKMRHLLKTALNNENAYAVVNFFRAGLQEQGGGHFSPVAAYDAGSDRFLILDVARYKYPPMWVTAADLWKSINTTDTDAHKQRGILIIKK